MSPYETSNHKQSTLGKKYQQILFSIPRWQLLQLATMYNSSPHNKSKLHKQRLDLLPTPSDKALNNSNVYICIYIYMDAYMFVILGHVLFFLNNKEHGMANYPTWNTHLSPLTSVMSPPQLPPSTSHLPPFTSHLSPLTSHLSPPHASQPSPLTSHAHRSPPTIPSHSHLQPSPGLWLSQTESHTRSHSDSDSHTPTDTDSQSRSHSDTDSDIHPDLLTRCHTSLDNAQSAKTWNTSCKTKSTTNLTNSAMIYVCPKQHLIHTLNTRNLSKPPRCFFVCF